MLHVRAVKIRIFHLFCCLGTLKIIIAYMKNGCYFFSNNSRTGKLYIAYHKFFRVFPLKILKI